jgi:predicted nucleic acid-binding protein
MSADLRLAVDTNVLVYAEGVNGADRKAEALNILQDFAEWDVIVPVQALGELFSVLTRKAKWTAHDARAAILSWRDAYTTVGTTTAVMIEAMELVTSHKLSLWDSVMLAAAAQADCQMLLSEDLQHGFTWRGVVVQNPFTPEPSPTT